MGHGVIGQCTPKLLTHIMLLQRCVAAAAGVVVAGTETDTVLTPNDARGLSAVCGKLSEQHQQPSNHDNAGTHAKHCLTSETLLEQPPHEGTQALTHTKVQACAMAGAEPAAHHSVMRNS